MPDVTPLTDDEILSDTDFDDLGTIIIAEAPPQEGTPAGADRPPARSAPAAEPDEPPAHARRKRGRPPGSKNEAPKRARIAVGIRADINAKVSMPLEVGGTIWAARDQLCGGVFLAQRPAIAEALTDIICESPDLVAWFTGPASGFMRYLNLAGALWPVVEMIGAHHVYHSVEVPPMERRGMPEPAPRAA
jgi:hypothetical protein